MIEIKGTHNTARCFCETLEDTAARQIQTVCNQAAFADCKIRIMPDVHAFDGDTGVLTDFVLDLAHDRAADGGVHAPTSLW